MFYEHLPQHIAQSGKAWYNGCAKKRRADASHCVPLYGSKNFGRFLCFLRI